MAGYLAPVPGRCRADPVWGGAGKLTVPVRRLGVPGSYRVRLHEQSTGALVRERFSDMDGLAVFERIATTSQAWYAVAFDHTPDPEKAAVADRLTAESMG